MSAAVEQESATVAAEGPRVNLRRSDRGPMAGGGTVSHEVFVAGRWVGWVGDHRAWLGHKHGGRRWFAAWREAGDETARWNSDGYRTRSEALDALVAAVSVGVR